MYEPRVMQINENHDIIHIYTTDIPDVQRLNARPRTTQVQDPSPNKQPSPNLLRNHLIPLYMIDIKLPVFINLVLLLLLLLLLLFF